MKQIDKIIHWLFRQSNLKQEYKNQETLDRRIADLLSKRGTPEMNIAISEEKIERLMYLCHSMSARCSGKDGCAYKHCGAMKSLCMHIRTCKNEQCAVTHCYSSKLLLAQYRACCESASPCEPFSVTCTRLATNFLLTVDGTLGAVRKLPSQGGGGGV